MLLKTGSCSEAGFSNSGIAKLDKYMEGLVDSGFTPNTVHLVARNGIIVTNKAFGKLGPEEAAEDMAVSSIFPISSISKSITATGIMILAEEGLVSPVRPVQEYIPEFKGEGKENVCVYHLLTHTSGMKDDVIWQYVDENRDRIIIPELEEGEHPKIHEKLYLGYNAPLWKAPGEQMSYCNYGFELLGEIIRRVSEKSVDDFFRERIFNPLDMKDSFFIVPDNVKHRIVRFSKEFAFGSWLSNPEHLSTPSCAAGVYTTVKDLAVFGQMLLNGGIYNGKRIISKASVKAMTRNQIPGVKSVYKGTLFREAGWGLGWMISENKREETGTLRSPETFSHSGAGCSLLLVDPVNKVVEVCFNTSKTYTNKYDRKFDYITDIVIGSIVD